MLCFSFWLKKATQFSYFEKKSRGLLHMTMVFYLLVPLLPWRIWPLSLDMEN